MPTDSKVRVRSVTGVVLAGGQGRRMGGQDKGLVEIQGQPMVAWVLERLRPQVDVTLINANRNSARYSSFGSPVIRDDSPDYAGPLAGMLSALRLCTTEFILTVPCDSPLFPVDLAQRLLSALETERATLAVAHADGRMQPVFALIPRVLLEDLEAFLASGERKIDRWYARHATALADFSVVPEAFINVNTPEDAADVARLLHASPEEIR